MDDEHFGSCLRRAREQKALTVGDVSASTKVPRSSVEALAAAIAEGPADPEPARAGAMRAREGAGPASATVERRRKAGDSGAARRPGHQPLESLPSLWWWGLRHTGQIFLISNYTDIGRLFLFVG